MIEAKELRIGNWLNIVDPYFGKIETSISADVICDIEKMQANGKPIPYAPIPLTEEWLLKFGFEKKQIDDGYWFELGLLTSTDNLHSSELLVGIWHNGDYIDDVLLAEFVHELQNLYFALTGQELEIKQ